MDADDVAASAVAVLTTPGHVGRTYDLTRRRTRGTPIDEVAALLSRATGREVRYVDVPPTAANAMMAAGVCGSRWGWSRRTSTTAPTRPPCPPT